MPYIDLKAYCRLPFHRLKIASDGRVMMCGYQNQEGIGNILTQSFEEIWLGKTARDIREEVLRSRLHPICQTSNCPFATTASRKPYGLPFTRYPIELELDLPMQHCGVGGEVPDAANPACLMCERNLAFQRHEDKLQEICSRMKSSLQHFENLIIVGIAEPFWKNKIYDILDWLEFGNHPHIKLSTITNGQQTVSGLLRYPKTCVTFSFDAATPATYQLLRRGDYQVATSNFLEYSQQIGNNQLIRIHNNINLFNLQEVDGMLDLAAQGKVSEVEFNPTAGLGQLGVTESNAYLFYVAQKRITRKAETMKLKVSFLRNLYLHYEIDKARSIVEVDNIEGVAQYLKVPVETIKKLVAKYHYPCLI